MTDRIRFTVPGPTVGKQSVRVTGRGTFMPARTREYMDWVRACFIAVAPGHTPWEGPVGACMTVYVPAPKSWPKWRRELLRQREQQYFPLYCARRPDGDNSIKAVLDALNHVAYLDDAQVAHHAFWRFWTLGQARAEVELWPFWEPTRENGR